MSGVTAPSEWLICPSVRSVGTIDVSIAVRHIDLPLHFRSSTRMEDSPAEVPAAMQIRWRDTSFSAASSTIRSAPTGRLEDERGTPVVFVMTCTAAIQDRYQHDLLSDDMACSNVRTFYPNSTRDSVAKVLTLKSSST